MSRRTILCYGDSNTHGTAPMASRATRRRIGPEARWTGVLAAQLGAGWQVIEEGLGGRTTVHDDPIEGASRNGRTYLLPCLESHRPLDAIVLMLGTNDLKSRFAVTPADIAWSLSLLIDLIRQTGVGPGGGMPNLLLVAPTPIVETGFLGAMFIGGAAKSEALGAAIAEVAAAQGVGFLDAGAHVRVSPVDGIHFDEAAHARLGQAIATALAPLLA